MKAGSVMKPSRMMGAIGIALVVAGCAAGPRSVSEPKAHRGEPTATTPDAATRGPEPDAQRQQTEVQRPGSDVQADRSDAARTASAITPTGPLKPARLVRDATKPVGSSTSSASTSPSSTHDSANSRCLASIESLAQARTGQHVMLGDAAFAYGDRLDIVQDPRGGPGSGRGGARAAMPTPHSFSLLQDGAGRCFIRYLGASGFGGTRVGPEPSPTPDPLPDCRCQIP